MRLRSERNPPAPLRRRILMDGIRPVLREQCQGECPVLPRIPVHTYSIVAQDPATGDMGIAVQSHWFCVGAGVIWAEAGVGVLAVQADADPAYGDRGLPRLAAGA